MTRIEAAVKAWDRYWGDRYGDEALEEMGDEVKVALDAADAHDAAHGIHRVSLEPLKHELFGAIYGATDKRHWAVSDVVDAVSAVLAAAVEVGQ